jgi:hypothetical protein
MQIPDEDAAKSTLPAPECRFMQILSPAMRFWTDAGMVLDCRIDNRKIFEYHH